MPIKSRGTAICLAILSVVIPFNSLIAAEDTEKQLAQHEGIDLAAFVRDVVDATPTINAARAEINGIRTRMAAIMMATLVSTFVMLTQSHYLHAFRCRTCLRFGRSYRQFSPMPCPSAALHQRPLQTPKS